MTRTKQKTGPRAVTDPKSDSGVPADWRCSLQRPNTNVVEGAIDLIEGAGGREPSSARKHLREVRELEFEQHRIAGPGNEDLRATVESLSVQLDSLDGTITRINNARMPVPSETLDEASKLSSALFEKRAALDERMESLNTIGAARREAQDKLFHALNTSLRSWAAGLAETSATDLWEHRPDRYHPERITVAVLKNVALIRQAAVFAKQLGNYQPKASISQLTDMLDGELELVLDRAAGTGVSLQASVAQRSRPAGPPGTSLEENLEEKL